MAAVVSSAHAAKPSRDNSEAFGRPIDLYSSEQRSKTFNGCRHLFPKNQPIALETVDPAWGAVGLCSNHFAVLYSTVSRTPLVVVERLSRLKLQEAKGEKRSDFFFADPRLKNRESADLNDFKQSGYDRGHLANAADQPDAASMAQSFALSNMVAQDPTNNRKIWAKLESDTRKYVMRASGDVFVFSGPLFETRARMIGDNRVWIPSHLFKVVLDANTGKAWAHILENSPTARIERPMTVEAFGQRTGWRF